MSRKLLLIALLGIFCLSSTSVYAQSSGTLTGKVTDQNTGDPLPGANVILTQLNKGAATDADGSYSIAGIEPGDYSLKISYIGYKPLVMDYSIKAGNNELNISLEPDVSGLEDVVVTGIASRTSKAVSEVAVSKVDAEKLTETQSFQDISQLMGGKVAGVNITPSSGNVGGGIRFKVRSGGGLNGDGQPVIYIDGVRVDNSEIEGFGVGGQGVGALADLNPDDIASIDILKGPAAAALYGTSGSNGVVLITTKRGQTVGGRGSVSLRYKSVIGFNDQSYEYSKDNFYSADAINSIFKRGPIFQNQLSLSGGTEFIRYYTSFDSRSEEGILNNNKMDRQSFRANFDAFPTEELTVSVNTGFTVNDITRPNNDNNIYGYLGNTILAPGGSTYYFTDSTAVEGIKDDMKTNRFIGSVKLNYRPIQNMELNASVGYDGSDLRQDQTFPANLSYQTVPKGERDIYNRQNYQLTYDLNARYHYNVTSDFEATTVVGTQMFNRKLRTNFLSKQDFNTALITNIGAGETYTDGDEGFTHIRSAGVFAQQEMNYKNTYFLTLAGRQDYASSVGQDAPNIFYPKVSGAIRLDQLNLLPEAVSFLKVRAAYGETGQLPGLNDGSGLLWAAEPSGYGAGATLDVIGNSAIKPERVKELEIGLEANFFDNYGFEVTYYNQWARKSIIDFRNSPSTGMTASSVPYNVGQVNGKGIEASLNLTPIQRRNTSLDLNVIWNYSTNEVKDLGGAQPIFDGFDLNVIKVGLPRAAFYPYKVNGALFNNDGTYAGADISSERVFVGTPYPEHQGSFSANFRFLKNFNFYVLTDWSLNQYIYNNTALFATLFANNVKRDRLGAQIGLNTMDGVTAYDPGTQEYKDAANAYAKLTPDSDYGYVEKADFFKVREISLSYNFGDVLQKVGASNYVKDFRVSLSARNIYTNTTYSGADPEVNFDGARSLSRGQDFLTLQNPSVYYVTVSLGL